MKDEEKSGSDEESEESDERPAKPKVNSHTTNLKILLFFAFSLAVQWCYRLTISLFRNLRLKTSMMETMILVLIRFILNQLHGQPKK